MDEPATICRSCGSSLSTDGEHQLRFFKAMAFRFSGQHFPLLPSNYCSSCQHQRRLSFRNELNLYQRTSEASGKKILSLYHSRPLWGDPYTVMLEEEWRGEHFNPFSFGKKVDFSRPFFEQYAELHKTVPRMSIVNLQNENSPYTSHTGYSKNCYLLPCSEHCEDCYYGRFLQKCRNCVDCTTAHRAELCYQCFQIEDCYRCAFLSLGIGCSDCYFSENLLGCQHCLFCDNLRHTQYCIYNKPVAPSRFDEEIKRILVSAAAIRTAGEEWQKIRLARIRRPANIRKCENCTGDFLLESHRCRNCLDATGCEDCFNLITAYQAKDCVSCSNIYLNCELNYEMLGSTQIYHCAFGFYVFRSHDVLYSEYIYDSQDLFGCVGVTRGKNAILNQSYTRAEYESLAKRLAAHMLETGEWSRTFPPCYSPFGYNETVASDLFPLQSGEARRLGFWWREGDEREKPAATDVHPPDDINQCSDAVSSAIYLCEKSGESFRIISQELAFYRKLGIALPTLSPRTRHRHRESLRFPLLFRKTNCPACGAVTDTNVPFEIERQLRCENCYQAQFTGME